MKRICKLIAALLSLQILFGSIPAMASASITLQVEENDGSSSIRDDGESYVLWYGSGKVWWNTTIPESGKYQVTLRASAGGDNPNGAKPLISVDGEQVINTAYIPLNNYYPFVEYVLGEIALTAGNHTIMLSNTDTRDSGNIMADWLKLEKTGRYPLGTLGDKTVYTADVCSGKNGVNEITAGDKIAADFTAGGWISYDVTSAAEEVYILSANVKADAGTKIGIYVNGDKKTESEPEASSDGFGVQELGRVLIPAGGSEIKIAAEELSGSAAISEVIFTKVKPGYPESDSLGYLKVEFEEFGPGGEGVDYHDNVPGKDADYYVDGYGDVDVGRISGGGLCVGASGGEWLRYHVTIPKTGKYRINVRAAKPSVNILAFTFGDSEDPVSVSMQGTGGWADYQDFDFGLVDLTAGPLIIRADELSGNANLDYFELQQVDTDFSVYSVFAGDMALIEERPVNRGTDAMFVYFSNDIDAESAEAASVSINSADGENIPVDFSAVDNELKILLKKTLDFEKEYILTISDISGEYGALGKAYEAVFATGGVGRDAGNAAVEITKSELNYESVTIEGVLKSSQDIGISGRKITLDVAGANFSSAQAAYTVSEENGKFAINWSIPEGNDPGSYSFTVKEEYGGIDSVTKIYTPQSYERQILDELKSTASTDDVFAWFTAYQQIIGIDINADIAGFADRNVFLRHFTGAEIGTVAELLTKYDMYLCLETINNGNETVIEAFLADADKCGAIGIDPAADDVIVTNRGAFIADIAALGDMSEPERFRQEYEKILNKWIAAEYSKTDVSINADDAEAYVGTGVSIPLTFSEEQSDVKKAEIVIESASSDILDTVLTTGITADTVSKQAENGKIIIKAENNTAKTVTSLGSIQFTAPTAGNYLLTISGSVGFEKETSDKKITFSTNILSKSVNITSKTNSNYSRPTGGGQGFTPPVDPSKNNDDKTPQDSVYSFNDLDNTKWAIDSINYLLAKGIIAENDEKRFYPDRYVTREEFVKMIVTAIGAEDPQAGTELSDVPKDAWFYQYVAAAQKAGIVYGNEYGQFGAGQNITRQDMSVILSRTLKLSGYEVSGDGAERFADDGEISEYAKEGVYNMRRMGIMNGVGENMCAPHSNATRAMAAKMIYDMMKAVGR